MKRHAWLLAAIAFSGMAQASEADHVHASGGWIRLLPAGLPAGGFVALSNDGTQPVTLTGASSTAYGEVMLHQSSTDGGMGRMVMVDKLAIPAHGMVALAPGGYHLMLEKAAKPLTLGNKVTIKLSFQDGSSIDVPFEVKAANAL